MTVQYDQAISAAAKTVHDKVWARHWKEGERAIHPARVIDYVREIRVAVSVDEQRLPQELLNLLGTAKKMVADKNVQPIALVDIIVPLKKVMSLAA